MIDNKTVNRNRLFCRNAVYYVMFLIKSTTYHIVLIIVTGFFLLQPLQSGAQVKLLSSDTVTLLKTQRAITCLYNWNFDSAHWYTDKVKENYSEHPVVPFLDAMLLFWENIPKPLTDSMYVEHIKLIEKSVAITQEMLEEDENNIEAIFFNLTGRGVLMRYYAASKQKMKAVGEARKVYRYTKKARKLKDKFTEFYFMVGLYDYFREAYPERYPLYKPFAWFFESGDKEKGLEQLEYAANNGVFSVPEALNYLAYIYNKYEENPEKGILYLAKLGELYPQNLWFKVDYLRVLTKMEKYESVKSELDDLREQFPKGFYYAMCIFYEAQMADLYYGNTEKAFALYELTEQELEEYRNIYYVEVYWKELYEGFIRYYSLQENDEMVKVYKQKLNSIGK